MILTYVKKGSLEILAKGGQQDSLFVLRVERNVNGSSGWPSFFLVTNIYTSRKDICGFTDREKGESHSHETL